MIRRRPLTVCLCLAAFLQAVLAADDNPKGADGSGNAAVIAVEFLLKNIGAVPRETVSRAAQGH